MPPVATGANHLFVSKHLSANLTVSGCGISVRIAPGVRMAGPGGGPGLHRMPGLAAKLALVWAAVATGGVDVPVGLASSSRWSSCAAGERWVLELLETAWS